MLSCRRSPTVSQGLALKLHTVLTAPLIWFPRWWIRNNKLQLGRLLVADTLTAEVTADRKGREAQLWITAQGSLSAAQEALRYACMSYGQIAASLLTLTPAEELGFLLPRHSWLQEDIWRCYSPSGFQTWGLSEIAWGLAFKGTEWSLWPMNGQNIGAMYVCLFISSCFCLGNASFVTLSRKLYFCSLVCGPILWLWQSFSGKTHSEF